MVKNHGLRLKKPPSIGLATMTYIYIASMTPNSLPHSIHVWYMYTYIYQKPNVGEICQSHGRYGLWKVFFWWCHSTPKPRWCSCRGHIELGRNLSISWALYTWPKIIGSWRVMKNPTKKGLNLTPFIKIGSGAHLVWKIVDVAM